MGTGKVSWWMMYNGLSRGRRCDKRKKGNLPAKKEKKKKKIGKKNKIKGVHIV